MANVKITPLAESDLEEIFEYIAEDNIDSAIRVIGDIGHRFELLADNPPAWKSL